MILLWSGTIKSFGEWNKNIEYVTFILIATCLGIFISWCVNNDFPLWMFRKESYKNRNMFLKPFLWVLSKIKLSEKTLHPSEWFSFLKGSSECLAILHLEGERRLQGYMLEYPDDPQNGHFIVTNASWLLDDGKVVPLTSVDSLLIDSKEVIRIEKLIDGTLVKDVNQIKEQNKFIIYNLY